MYIVVGGKGTAGNNRLDTIPYRGYGGYNGGGNSAISVEILNTTGQYYETGGGGGGATHIATTNRGVLSNYDSYRNDVLIVSGAGGGSMAAPSGNGGGFKGTNSVGYVASSSNSNIVGGNTVGGTQNTGYAFGQGQDALDGIYGGWGAEGNGGGGGGWYGGTASQVIGEYSDDSGAGGSGYLKSTLTNKAMYCYKCEESGEPNTYTVSTYGDTTHASERDTTNCPNGYSSNPISKCAKAGHGYARITLVSLN